MDMLIVVAALLLVGMVACWIVLPGSTTLAADVRNESEILLPVAQHS